MDRIDAKTVVERTMAMARYMSEKERAGSAKTIGTSVVTGAGVRIARLRAVWMACAHCVDAIGWKWELPDADYDGELRRRWSAGVAGRHIAIVWLNICALVIERSNCDNAEHRLKKLSKKLREAISMMPDSPIEPSRREDIIVALEALACSALEDEYAWLNIDDTLESFALASKSLGMAPETLLASCIGVYVERILLERLGWETPDPFGPNGEDAYRLGRDIALEMRNFDHEAVADRVTKEYERYIEALDAD